MTKEETKLWLRSYRAKKLEIDKLDGMIKQLEAEKYSPKTSRLDKIGGSGSAGSCGPFERLVFKQDELAQLYKQKRLELLDEQLKIEATIARLNETERLLFRCRYIDGMTWEEVAVTINYSWSQMHTIHSQALDKLSD